MSRRQKLAVYLLLVGSLVAISAVILTSRQDGVEKINETAIPAVDQAKLESEYKEKLKAAMDGYSELAENGGLTLENAKKIKEELLGLTVPGKYKDLHIGLVLGLTKIEDSLALGAPAGEAEGQKEIETALASQSWLSVK